MLRNGEVAVEHLAAEGTDIIGGGRPLVHPRLDRPPNRVAERRLVEPIRDHVGDPHVTGERGDQGLHPGLPAAGVHHQHPVVD